MIIPVIDWRKLCPIGWETFGFKHKWFFVDPGRRIFIDDILSGQPSVNRWPFRWRRVLDPGRDQIFTTKVTLRRVKRFDWPSWWVRFYEDLFWCWFLREHRGLRLHRVFRIWDHFAVGDLEWRRPIGLSELPLFHPRSEWCFVTVTRILSSTSSWLN